MGDTASRMRLRAFRLRRALPALAAAAALALAGCSANVSAPGGAERTVLLAPDFVAHAAVPATDDPQARWLLGQPRSVRTSYVHAVLDRHGDRDLLAQAWLLGQPDAVRQSYVREVVQPKLQP